MKITHVIRNFEIGGLETVVLRLAEMQAINGHRVRVVCVEKEGQGVLDYMGRGFEIINLNKKNKYIALIRVLVELITNRPEVVHTHNFLSNVYGAYSAFFLRIPVVLTLHSGEDRDPLELKRWSLFLPRHIACVSKEIMSSILSSTKGRIQTYRISAVTNGIDPQIFVDSSGSDVRSEFGISADKIIFGTVGRLQPVKNQRILIEALEILNRKFEKIRLMIVGDGPLLKELELLAIFLGVRDKVCMTGSRNDVSSILSSMDIFVLPSLAEGAPISLIEAMSAKKPVIASAVGGIVDVINDGVNGFVIPVGDVDALVNRIEFLVKEGGKAAEIAENGYRTICNNYSMERMYSSYQDIYENINYNKSIS